MLLILRKFIWDNVHDVLTFPLWWYSRGLREFFFILARMVRRTNESLGVSLWLSNLFTPMYGQRDWQGRIISFFMRCVQLCARGLVFVIFLVFVCALFAVWIVILPLAVYGIVYSVLEMLAL